MIHGDMTRYSNGRKKMYNAWGKLKNKMEPSETTFTPSYSYRRSSTSRIKSLDTGVDCSRKVEPTRYTGTLVKGISQTHKSNAVPIISEQEAKDHASMRR